MHPYVILRTENMLRFSLMLMFFMSVLHAQNIEAKYSVEFGVVGEIARAHATLAVNGSSYMIDANITVVGNIAKAVTNNLKERHISKGHIENALLVTDMYQMIKSYAEVTSTTIYRVDHKTKRVTRQEIRWKQGKEILNEKVTLGYYGTDDMMTLFLNLPGHIRDKFTSRNYRFKVVGADRKNGRVDIYIPTKKALGEIQKNMGNGKKGDWYSRVVMHRQLYHSKKGELDLRIGKEGMVDKAVLKDLIFFGDVRIKRR